MYRIVLAEVCLATILVTTACRQRSDDSSTALQASAPTASSPMLPLTKLGLFNGNTDYHGEGEKCHVLVHDKKGSDWSFLGFGGIKSLTISLSKNLFVQKKTEIPCFNGADSNPWCHAIVGEYEVYVSYTSTKEKRPHVSVSQRGENDAPAKLLRECWHLTKSP